MTRAHNAESTAERLDQLMRGYSIPALLELMAKGHDTDEPRTPFEPTALAQYAVALTALLTASHEDPRPVDVIEPPQEPQTGDPAHDGAGEFHPADVPADV